MLQGLRAKVTGALNAALGDGGGGAGGGAHPQHHLPSPSSTSDPRLMRAERLVAAATSDQLPPDTPDWGATLELVDMINADPPLSCFGIITFFFEGGRRGRERGAVLPPSSVHACAPQRPTPQPPTPY
jgi:hypothetical protein